MPNILILAFDIVGVSIMGGVGISGTKYFAHLMRENDLKNLRYIWVPNIISFGFYFALVFGMFINDVFGTFRTPFYFPIHLLLLIGSCFFGLGMYRFTRTIKSHFDSAKKAKATLEEVQSEITKRLEQGRGPTPLSLGQNREGQKSTQKET
ncbi:MAG: hypothetical protein JRN20_02510 [Nitrososphaerota archaeon]|nr:hypothetical protein [Nitrososphaerota archaeon]